MGIFRKKTIEQVKDVKSDGAKLEKSLTALDIFLMGLGAIIGTGIFVVTGVTAAEVSGPGVIASYAIAGIIAMIVAFAYTEVGSMIPSSGSVYAYSYVSLGEIFAWLAGWITILYCIISISTVCSGWSGYMSSILSNAGYALPSSITTIPAQGGLINLPAFLVAVLITLLLYKGTQGSVAINSMLVFVKIGVIILFIVLAIPNFDINNIVNHKVDYDTNLWLSHPFTPYGMAGIMAGAAQVFFGYSGFDSLATTAEECKNPERDLSLAIIGSLLVCMILYMLVSALTVGMVPYNELSNASPLAYALSQKGYTIGSTIVAVGAVAGMTTVILIMMYATSRIVYAISRDGLLPKFLARLHPEFNTPGYALIINGVVISLIAGFASLKIIVSLASLCALITFIIACVVLLVLRIKMPDTKRPFRCPIAFIIAPFAIIVCTYLIYTLWQDAGKYFVMWLIAGIIIYYSYSKQNSNMNKIGNK